MSLVNLLVPVRETAMVRWGDARDPVMLPRGVAPVFPVSREKGQTG